MIGEKAKRFSQQQFERGAKLIRIMSEYASGKTSSPTPLQARMAEPDSSVNIEMDPKALRRADEDVVETRLGLLASRNLDTIRARIPLEQRISGSFVGSAIGDALAAPTEFLSVDTILERWPPIGPTKLDANHYKVTDDTQMAIAVAKAIVSCAPKPSPENISKAISREFIVWLRDPENNRAPGNTCISAARALESGVPWNEATVINSKGCGANMRVHPVAYRWWKKEDDALRSNVSQLQAAITHGHPTALAAADVTSLVVALLLRNVPVHDVLVQVLRYSAAPPTYNEKWLGPLWQRYGANSPNDYAQEGWTEVHEALKKIGPALLRNDGWSDPCIECGDGWIAEEALATGLFCFLGDCWDSMGARKALRRAAVTRGDSDSIACLAGAFAGACDGLETWPVSWRRILEYYQEIRDLSEKLLIA